MQKGIKRLYINGYKECDAELLMLTTYIQTAPDTKPQTIKTFILLKGSKVSSTITPSYVKHYNDRDIYKNIIDKNYVLTEDIVFSSPSRLASFVIGNTESGSVTIKNKNGKYKQV